MTDHAAAGVERRIEPPFYGSRGQLEHRLPCRSLDRLEVQRVGCARTDQRFDFLRDRVRKLRLEPPLSASASAGASVAVSSASAHCSHAVQARQPCCWNLQVDIFLLLG